ncbi:MAG: response regulator [Bacteroidetes bacterium]|nr:response regulator [Bacteroidota bacterium]
MFSNKNTPIAELIINDNFTCVAEVNTSFIKLFKFNSSDKVIGKSLNELNIFNPNGIKHIKEKLLREGEFNDEKMFCLTSKDEMLACLVTVQKEIQLQDNKYFIYFHDITQLHNLELQLEKSKQTAENALNLQAMFLANISHEIRTPINGILGFTELLNNTKLTHEQLDYLHSIKISGNNLIKIVNDILDSTKIEAGLIELENIAFNIATTIKETIKTFIPQALSKNIQINANIESNLPEIVYGDPTRLFQIISNLVNNALRFSKINGSVTINASVAQKNNSNCVIKFSVVDNGIGIEKDKIESIFEKFIQGDSSTTRNYGGSGLGLSIVKKLIELHKGNINVSSEKNIGSTFNFYIPFNLTHQNDFTIEVTQTNTNFLNNKKILLVEDNEINQKLTSTILSLEGAKVTIAHNGEIALQLLQNLTYDLILMDIQMPVLDGISTSLIIRKELNCVTPIIAMTANVITGEKKVCLKSGMNDYISKPFSANDLIKIINKHIANSNLIDKEEFNNKTSNNKQHTSLKYLYEFSKGNKLFIKEMIELFLEQSPNDIDRLNVAVENYDFDTIKSIIHRLQTSLGFIGFDENILKELKQVEEWCLNKTNFSEIKKIIDDLINECKLAQIELKQGLLQL